MIKEKKINLDLKARKLEWNSDGLEAKLFQIQGIDIILKKGDNPTFWSYSSPSHELFVSLLKYFQEADNVPDLVMINSINEIPARQSTYCDGLSSADFLKKFYLNEQLPFFKDEKIIVNSTKSGLLGTDLINHFFGYVKEDNFIIGRTTEKGLNRVMVHENKEIPLQSIEKNIILDYADALNVMRGIYFFSPNNELLKEVYNSQIK